MIEVFDRRAREYDAWYETSTGRTVLTEEVAALRVLAAPLAHPWLEVGVGSGRFAAELHVEFGIDPAPQALSLSAHRGVSVAVSRGENLPFASATFGAVLIIATLCFVSEPAAVLWETRRVLRSGGGIILGVVPADGPWGKHYQLLATRGDPFYRHAHFFSRKELVSLLRVAGLRITDQRSALLWPPDRPPETRGSAVEGDNPNAGFLVCRVEVG